MQEQQRREAMRDVAAHSPAGAGAAGGDCVVSDDAGGTQGGRELAWARMEGARDEEGRVGLPAAM